MAPLGESVFLVHLALLAALLRVVSGESDVGGAQQPAAGVVAKLANRCVAIGDASGLIDGEPDFMDAIEEEELGGDPAKSGARLISSKNS